MDPIEVTPSSDEIATPNETSPTLEEEPTDIITEIPIMEEPDVVEDVTSTDTQESDLMTEDVLVESQSLSEGTTVLNFDDVTEPIESSILSRWRDEHHRQLLEQREKSEKRTADLRDKAKAEIEEFMKERNDKMEQSRKENRNGEEEVKRDLGLGGDNAWEAIAKLVDLSAGKTKGKDVSRMRQLLVEAKHKEK